MKIKTHRVCDICNGCIEGRGEVGYKIKGKEFGLDYMWHRMDICSDCMFNIIFEVKCKLQDKRNKEKNEHDS